MTETLLVATRNTGKVAEYADLLGALDVVWLNLADTDSVLEVVEDGRTFYDNALLKAVGYAADTGYLTLADDSGLEVDALDGDPGVHTARYGGADLSHAERYQKLLEALAGVPEAERTARFRCVIAVAAPDGRVFGSSSGVCEGRIALAPRGEGGFGYDPVFYVPELDQTMAELPPEVKHQISHRGRALRRLEPLLSDVLAGR